MAGAGDAAIRDPARQREGLRGAPTGEIEGLSQQAMSGEGGIFVEGAGTSETGIEAFEDGHDGRGGFLCTLLPD